MWHTVSTLAPLFASFGFLVVGHGLLGTLLPVRMAIDDFSIQSIGLISACYSIGFIIGTRVDARAIRSVRHIRTYAALSAIGASVTLAFVLFVDPLFWAAMRLLYGCAIAGLYMVMESWLNANTPRDQRGRVLGLYSAATYLGLGAGQFLLLVADPGSTTLFLLVAMLICLSLVPLTLGDIRSPELIDIRPLGLRELYRLQPVGLVGALGSGVIIGSFLGLGPVFAKDSGFSTLEISLFMGLTISAGFLLQWPIGAVSDRYSRDAVIPVVALCVAALSLAMALLGGSSVGALTGLAMLWGAFSFTLYPVSVALVNDYVDASQFVPASAGLLLTSSLGMIIGSLAAAEAMALVGSSGLFWMAALSAFVLAGATGLRRRAPAPPFPDESTSYQPLPRNSPYASTLDPRSEIGVQLEFDFEAEAGIPGAAECGAVAAQAAEKPSLATVAERRPVRTVPGETPMARLKARLKAASER